MKCPVCSMQSPAGVCARPHDAVAVAAFLRRERKNNGQPAPQSRTPNVERVDREDGVTLVIGAGGTHVVRGDLAALRRAVEEGDRSGAGREEYRKQKHRLERGIERMERLAELYGLEVEIHAPEVVS